MALALGSLAHFPVTCQSNACVNAVEANLMVVAFGAGVATASRFPYKRGTTSLSVRNKQLLLLTNLSSITKTSRTELRVTSPHGKDQAFISGKSKDKPCSSSLSPFATHAAENGSPQSQYEVDPETAREALLKLDQQLEALSEKQVGQPKIRASDIKLTRDGSTEEEGVGPVSGSALVFVSAVLFLFTIFYNILFYKVIKPSIDLPETGPDPAPSSNDTTSIITARGSLEPVLQLLPVAPDLFSY